jgi:hypothetical protein
MFSIRYSSIIQPLDYLFRATNAVVKLTTNIFIFVLSIPLCYFKAYTVKHNTSNVNKNTLHRRHVSAHIVAIFRPYANLERTRITALGYRRNLFLLQTSLTLFHCSLKWWLKVVVKLSITTKLGITWNHKIWCSLDSGDCLLVLCGMLRWWSDVYLSSALCCVMWWWLVSGVYCTNNYIEIPTVLALFHPLYVCWYVHSKGICWCYELEILSYKSQNI